jgi:hypothetical protein
VRRTAWLLVLFLAAPAAAQDDFREPARLLELDWSYDYFGGSEQGTALLIRFGPDLWRLEVARSRLDDPLHRAGEGWTLCAPGDSTLYRQAWGGALDALEGEPSRQLRALVQLAAGEPLVGLMGRRGPSLISDRKSGRDLARLPWSQPRIHRTDPDRLTLRWDDAAAPGLCDRLERRGLGRGAAGELWRFRTTPDGFELASNRRSGTLRLRRVGDAAVLADPFTATLPVWPLSEMDWSAPEKSP